jgi:hypothetical protein
MNFKNISLEDKLEFCHLAPYIIIRDSFHLNSNNILSTSRKNEKSIDDVNHLTTITDKHRSLLLPSSSRQVNNNEQVQQRKKNYLLAEFESVLTQISKK